MRRRQKRSGGVGVAPNFAGQGGKQALDAAKPPIEQAAPKLSRGEGQVDRNLTPT